jgi:hypothetical protein
MSDHRPQLPTSSTPLEANAVALVGGPRERGVVMVVVLAMMGILTLLASAAALRTSMDMREGGAERLERAAFRVSETGTYAVVSLASQMQGGFGDYVAAKTDGKLSMIDVGDEILALTGKDQSFGRELAAVGAVDFSTQVGQADSASTPGYEAGRYCFRTYRMITTSRIGAANPANLRESMVAGQTRLAASMTLGPVPCGN